MSKDNYNPRHFNDNLDAYIQRLGGRPSGPNKIMCRCPAHADKNPSLGVEMKGDRLVFRCYAGCDQRAVMDALSAIGLWQSGKTTERAPRPAPVARRPAPDMTEVALRIWGEAIPAQGTLAEFYLAYRGLPLPVRADIRFHKSCPFTIDGKKARHPALIGLMTEVIGGKPVGIQRIALTADGRNLRDSAKHKVKMTLGGSATSCVRLQHDVEIFDGIHIAEGIETAIGAWQKGFDPMWAMVSASRVKSFPLIPNLACVTVCADDDEAGIAAAMACAKRWADDGREAVIQRTDETGKDWADG